MAGTSEGEGREGAAGGRYAQLPLPLNSRRLCAAYLKRLATALEVPTTATGDEVRQMIEGKLIAQGQEPRNVQVVLGATPGSAFSLLEGTFLTVEEEMVGEGTTGEHEPGSGPQEHGEPEKSEQELQSLKTELETLKAENLDLRHQLEQEKACLREVWRTNCQCLAEYDELMA